MHGNVWEWVADCASGDLKAAAHGQRIDCKDDDPRVLRGGSWSDPPRRLRSAVRIAAPPTTRDQIAGFRVARSIAP
jgi:formylglycine-generating enzyme required for sulfatase activity